MTVTLRGTGVGEEQVVAVARRGEAVALAPAAKAKMDRSRMLVEKAASSREPVYGVSTGFGALAGTRVAPLRQARPFQAAGEHYSIELLRSQREAEKLRANHLDGRPHLLRADIDKTSPFENVFDSHHAREVAAESGRNGAPAVSGAEDGGIRPEIPYVLEVRAAGVADQVRFPGNNPLDGSPPPDLPRQAIGLLHFFAGHLSAVMAGVGEAGNSIDVPASEAAGRAD